MTRPEGANERFIRQMPDALRAHFKVVLSPLVRIVPTPAKPNIGPEDAAIFTSSNAVDFALEGQGRVAFCVGAATCAKAIRAGWRGSCLGGTSDELVAELIANPTAAFLWHLSGVHVRGDIVDRLSQAGMSAKRAVLYDQILMELTSEAYSLLAAQTPVVVPIFSPRTAQQFAENCPSRARPYLLAMSDAVAQPIRVLSEAQLETAHSPTAEAMVKSLEKLACRISLG